MTGENDRDHNGRCVIRLSCPSCGEADVTSVLEHEPDSVQARVVHNATKTLAEEHRTETGHGPVVTKEGKPNR